MERLKAIINAKFRVEKRLDDLHHPCGFDVVRTLPEGHNPEHDEYICSLPDGMSQQQEMIAGMIAAIPEMLERLFDHCEWCADCDWQNAPDQECRFGQLWRKLCCDKRKCSSCHGTGYRKSHCDTPDPVCPDCNGTGEAGE